MKKLKLVFIINIIFVVNIMADFQFVGNISSYEKFDDRIEIMCDNALFNIYPLQNNLVRFRYTNQTEFSKAPSYGVINNSLKTNFNFSDRGDYLEVSTGELNIQITKVPCRVSIYDKNMNLINSDEKSFGVSFDYDEVRCHKTLFDDELFYGLGEKTGNLQKRGGQYTLWNTDTPAYSNKTDAIYQSIPFFIGVRNKKAYGIYFDNTYKSYFNFGASNNRFYWFGAEKGEMDYYFIGGPEIKKIISTYTNLTGRMELPPMWSLGYQQSKWSYYPESKVRNIAQNFRERDIPCDVIYLDIHYMNGYRVFTWDEERFPHPKKMLSDLKEDGFKVITIVDPGVKADTTNYKPAVEGLEKDLFAKYPDGVPYQGEVWPSWAYFPDFTKQETRDWWGKWNSGLIEQGLAGIWNDMNEPAVWGNAFIDLVQFDDNGFGSNHKKIHNVYALEMAKSTFNGLKNNLDDFRPFLLTRAGFTGIQRYAAVWTGDNVANEEHLQLACTMLQGMGLSGLSFVGSDVGGFFEEPTPNLYARWIQMAALTPFFRGHTIINTKDQEPWAFGDYIESIARDAIKLRYKLMPYLYNEFYKSTQTGIPLLRSMIIDYQDDPNSYFLNAQYQFMLGENILVAPVVKENKDFKKLYLPKGKWIEYWTNKIYDGSQWIIIDAPLERVPLFVKEGAIIPFVESQNYIGEKELTDMEIKIFPNENSSYTLYEDDGISQQYRRGNFLKTKFDVSKSENELEINVNKVEGDFNTDTKIYTFTLMNFGDFNQIKLNDTELKKVEKGNLGNTSEGFCYNNENNNLIIKVKKADKLKLNISLK